MMPPGDFTPKVSVPSVFRIDSRVTPVGISWGPSYFLTDAGAASTLDALNALEAAPTPAVMPTALFRKLRLEIITCSTKSGDCGLVAR
jgi:hypothetical protein